MRVLIIDDERSIRNTLKEILEFEGHQITLAADGAEGLEAASSASFDVIFCDIKMPGMDGIEVLDKLMAMGIDSSVVMITGHGSVDTAVECIKKGAFDFIQKPLDLNRILITLKNATEKTTLVKETKILKKRVGGIQEIIGESEPIVRIKEMIGCNRCQSAGYRLQRNGQGACGTLAPPGEQQKFYALCGGKLRCHTGRTYRERTLWTREGRLYLCCKAA